MGHEPVLLAEAMTALAPERGGLFLDGTFGGGGYTRAILRHAAARVIALDRDPQAADRLDDLLDEPRFQFVALRFSEMESAIPEPPDGVVLDLGVSSFQLDEAERGFSFQAAGPLDMRMEREGPSAADAIRQLSEAALAQLFSEYGEENDAKRIARAIVQQRAAQPITTTQGLAQLVEQCLGGRRGERLHPATRVFQALRLLVNDELGELARGLNAAERALKPGGRLVVVSFHSLEDRLVKRWFTARSGGGGEVSRHAPLPPPGPAPSFLLESRRPVTPCDQEVQRNPRARSASLRWGVRTEAAAWSDENASSPLAPLAEAEWDKVR